MQEMQNSLLEQPRETPNEVTKSPHAAKVKKFVYWLLFSIT